MTSVWPGSFVNLKLTYTRPIIVFDLETTGLDSEKDKIVEIAAIKLYPPGGLLFPQGGNAIYHTFVNPTIPIPAEASAIHGITDDSVKDCPTFAQIADEVLAFFSTCDIGGFNVKFDLEFLRAALGPARKELFDSHKPRVIDAMEIYKRNEPRGLEAAVKFYLGEAIQNTHSALADTEYTARVLAAQLERYTLPETIEGLNTLLNAPPEGYLDKDKKLKWDGDHVVFAFGQHSGRKLSEVPSKYLSWILDKDFSDAVKNIVRAWIVKGELPTRA